MIKNVLAVALAAVAACAPSHAAHSDLMRVDDSRVGQSLEHFSYTGYWEHLRGRSDGRYAGTSSRTRHGGDTVVFPFVGSAVRVYGVRGPNGGDAAIGIDGRYYGTAGFFASKKQAHVLVFGSPPLTEGAHTLGIVVKGDVRAPHRAYVNLDDVEVLRPQ